MTNNLHLGTTAVTALFLGSTSVLKVYLGSTLVWEGA